MRANRLSVLGAFAVGCLSSAALFGFWRAESAADAKSRARESELAAARVARRAVPLSEAVTDTPRGAALDDTAQPSREPGVEPSAPAVAPELATQSSPAVGGSAVSDVLM